jgi:N,N'-diacetyllegionaminate synthase
MTAKDTSNGPGRRWIIAEAGSVHDGSFGNACKLVELAAECGAHAVKFQTHIAEAETLANAPAPSYFRAEPRFDYFKRTAFSLDQWKELARLAREKGLAFISSPFSLEAVEFLEQVGLDAYKVPSGEVTNTPLLELLAQTKRPVIMSSGMSDWNELDRAVETLKPGGDLTVLQCTSAYPCPVSQAGVNVVAEIIRRYQVPAGFSDHTESLAAALGACMQGATVIEKHYTFSRRMYGSDAQFGMEPEDFTRYCAEVRNTWTLLDNPVDKNDLKPYLEMKSIFEKSIVTATAIAAGQTLSRELLTFKKPGTGIRADRVSEVLGKKALRDLPKDHLLNEKDLQ